MATIHRPDTGILCFRVEPKGVSAEDIDALQHRIYEAVLQEGKRSISITRVNGQSTLRLGAISPEVTFDALKETISEIRTIAKGS